MKKRDQMRESEGEIERISLLPPSIENNTVMKNLKIAMEKKILDEYSITDRHEGGCCQNLAAMI
jgi:hypothetical protein